MMNETEFKDVVEFGVRGILSGGFIGLILFIIGIILLINFIVLWNKR